MGLQQDIYDTAPGGAAQRALNVPAQLTAKQKAAVIVRLLLSQNVSPALDRLTLDMQRDLARVMGTLGPINRATLAEVVHEFTDRLDTLALTSPKGLAEAIALLEPYISPVARDGLRAEAEAGDPTDPWRRLAAYGPERLRPLLLSESAEIAAILLSKLGVAKAATLLAGLPEQRAQVIAHAVSLTSTVSPQTVERIGLHLLTQMLAEPEPAFRASPVDRVGAILNAVNSGVRESLLGGLETRDAEFAGEVRRAIFTFHHIPKRIDPGDVPRILRRVDPDALTRAIAFGFETAPETVDFLLANMSRRLAEQIRIDAENTVKPSPEDGEAAMVEVVKAIRDLEEDCEIRLIPPED
jgi:flagellar motor switch protein FliG